MLLCATVFVSQCPTLPTIINEHMHVQVLQSDPGILIIRKTAILARIKKNQAKVTRPSVIESERSGNTTNSVFKHMHLLISQSHY